jgi:hypothetical protein
VFGLTRPKLPVTEERQRWIDRSFLRLASLVGVQRLLEATVVLPTPEHFPDRYDRSEDALRRMFCCVAILMQMNPADMDLTLFMTGEGMTRADQCRGERPGDQLRRQDRVLAQRPARLGNDE